MSGATSSPSPAHTPAPAASVAHLTFVQLFEQVLADIEAHVPSVAGIAALFKAHATTGGVSYDADKAKLAEIAAKVSSVKPETPVPPVESSAAQPSGSALKPAPTPMPSGLKPMASSGHHETSSFKPLHAPAPQARTKQ